MLAQNSIPRSVPRLAGVALLRYQWQATRTSTLYLRRTFGPSETMISRDKSYALETKRCVEGASIKRTVLPNYFYGNKSVFEDFIQYFEGRYGQAMGRLQQREIIGI